MFRDKSLHAKQAALKTFINNKMAEEAFVREHMLKMIVAFKETDVLVKGNQCA